MTRQKAAASKGQTRRKRAAKAPPPPSRGEQALSALWLSALLVGVITLLSALSSSPSAVTWRSWLAWLLGLGWWLIGPLLMIIGLWGLMNGRLSISLPARRLLGAVLLTLVLFGLGGYWQISHPTEPTSQYGGVMARGLFQGMQLALGQVGTLVVLGVLTLLGGLMLMDRSLANLRRDASDTPPTPLDTAARQRTLFDESPPPSITRPSLATRLVEGTQRVARGLQLGWVRVARWLSSLRTRPTAPSPEPRRYRKNSPWALPPWRNLLVDVEENESDHEEMRQKSRIIEDTLHAFGVPGKVVAVNRGPTVTQYGVAPGLLRKVVRGQAREIRVRVSAITALRNDLALALSAPSIRIEAPVPGHSYVGIEVPNATPSPVTLRSTMESDEFDQSRSALALALGRDVMGNAVIADLARMPHLLIAGATGSGKSVCINSILCCLLCRYTPDELKLLLVDPKRVELIGYNGIPHLLVPVVIETEKVIGLLRWTLTEMERRYTLFSAQKVRNLERYNAKMRMNGEAPLPYLVLVIDELADLMMAAPEQVETMLCRLAQMARATGIHLILATQRPSVNVVTGLIKANFPARIAFAVASSVDSRVIMDRPGAEALLGRGDMLFQAPDAGAPVRAQGCFVSDEELAALNRFWMRQRPEHSRTQSGAPRQARQKVVVPPVQWDELIEEKSDEEDDLMPRARELVQEEGKASVSLIQRRLRVGYARAARLVDLLEAEGTIGKHVGPGKLRTVHDVEEESAEGGDV